MTKQRSVMSVLLIGLAIASSPSAVSTGAPPPPAPALSGSEGPALPVPSGAEGSVPSRAEGSADATSVAEGPAPSTVEGSVARAQIPPRGASTGWWSAVQEDIRRSEYHVTWQDQTYLPDLPAAYHAPNRAHNLRTYFTPEGPVVIPRAWPEGVETPPWRWGLHLIAWGREAALDSTQAITLHSDANRIEYRRPSAGSGQGLIEWYVNDERGLEQGFTLHSPPVPSSPGPLVLELALTGDLTPHMSDDGTAIEFTTPGGVRVLRYGALHATDATGRVLPAQMSLTQHATGSMFHVSCFTFHSSRFRPPAIRLTVDDSTARYPITVDPLATTPNWMAESDQDRAYFGHWVGTAGDVDGDGYSDVIVGAPSYDNGQTDEGVAFIYHGSPTGLSTTPDWTAEGDQDHAQLGRRVSTAGDVNGDGYADAIIGCGRYDNGEEDEGVALVYHGSATGLSATPDWRAEGDQEGACFGTSVATAGDVNGDGYSDVVVGAPGYVNGEPIEGAAFVWYGSATGLGADGTPTNADWKVESDRVGNPRFGDEVGTVGDVNGDGYADVIVGAPWYSNEQTCEGATFVYQGSASGLSIMPDWTAEGDQENAEFGLWAGTAGDVNGDGYADVIVGAPYYDHGEVDEGRANDNPGAAAGLSTPPPGGAARDPAEAEFGNPVGMAGDVDGDGYADVVVGVRHYDDGQEDEGAAFVYCGSAGGLSTTPGWTAESDQVDAEFGNSVGTAGDVNGDGYADIIIGALCYDNGQDNEGAAFVYHGSAAGLSTMSGWTAEGDQDYVQFGYSVGTAGDVNGDGYADAIVGAPYYDNGQDDEGRVFVYRGSATGLGTVPSWTAESDWAGAQFGHSVGTAGDVNGDGYADVAVGADHYANGQENEGRVYVYHGSTVGLSTTAAWSVESDHGGAYFGTSVGTAGDVNGDGYADVIVGALGYQAAGRAYVYHGSSTGLTAGSADWTAESDQGGAAFGASVDTAGDVDGDGYTDVIVGAPQYDNGQDNEGRTYVYFGSATGLRVSPNWTAEGNQEGAYFGRSAGTAGDVDGDGYADVIVGAYWYDNGQENEGRVYVFYGSVAGLGSPADWTAESDEAGAAFGWSVGTAGDVNGDGYADVVVGAYLYTGDLYEKGRAYVYHGSAAGLSTTADWTAEGDQFSAWFGWSVATAGDVNGDGYADVIIGANQYDNGQTGEGRAFLYYGNGGPGLNMTPRQMRTDGSVPIAPLGMSDSATSVRLRLTGRMPLGRDKVKLQWQVAPLGTPFTGPGVISGTSATWTDTMTTGAVIVQNVTGLMPTTPYHWRVRLLYRPGNRLGQSAGRWVHVPWNGWTEQDFRTPDEPTERHIYLPLIVRNYTPPVTFPLHIGDAIPQRPVAYQGEVFYTTSVRIPDPLPPGGRFYFSSQRDAVAQVLVDDELVVLLDAAKVFSYDFSTGVTPVPAIVEVPRTTMEQLAGRTVTIEYRDVYGEIIEASTMWLIWSP